MMKITSKLSVSLVMIQVCLALSLSDYSSGSSHSALSAGSLATAPNTDSMTLVDLDQLHSELLPTSPLAGDEETSVDTFYSPRPEELRDDDDDDDYYQTTGLPVSEVEEEATGEGALKPIPVRGASPVDITPTAAPTGAAAAGKPKPKPKPRPLLPLLPEAYEFETRIFASDGNSYDRFGHLLAVDGNYTYVATQTLGGFANKVYAEKRQSTPQQPKPLLPITANATEDEDDDTPLSDVWIEKTVFASPRIFDGYGSAIAAANGMIAIGAPEDSTLALNAGVVHIYTTEVPQKVPQILLYAPNAQPLARFGSALAAYGDLILVGARAERGAKGTGGSAYVFKASTAEFLSGERYTTYAVVTKVIPTGGGLHSNFGSAVCLSGEIAAIAADGDNRVAPLGGAVYVYAVNNETDLFDLEAVLAPSDLQEQAHFGSTIHFSNARGLVAAYDWSVYASCVYIFERAPIMGSRGIIINSWHMMEKLYSPASIDDLFGASLYIHRDEIAIIGAPGDTAYGTLSGAVYIYGYYDAGNEGDKSGISDLVGSNIKAIPLQARQVSAIDDHVSAIVGDDAVLVPGPADAANTGVAPIPADGAGDGAALDPPAGDGEDIAQPSVSPTVVTSPTSDPSLDLTQSPTHLSTFTLSSPPSPHPSPSHSSQWLLIAKISNADSKPYDRYGQAVAVMGNSLLVGADLGRGLVNNSGVIYFEDDILLYLENFLQNETLLEEMFESKNSPSKHNLLGHLIYEMTSAAVAVVLALVVLPTVAVASVLLVRASRQRREVSMSETDDGEENDGNVNIELAQASRVVHGKSLLDRMHGKSIRSKSENYSQSNDTADLSTSGVQTRKHTRGRLWTKKRSGHSPLATDELEYDEKDPEAAGEFIARKTAAPEPTASTRGVEVVESSISGKDTRHSKSLSMSAFPLLVSYWIQKGMSTFNSSAATPAEMRTNLTNPTLEANVNKHVRRKSIFGKADKSGAATEVKTAALRPISMKSGEKDGTTPLVLNRFRDMPSQAECSISL